jgi:hypothetical protein
VRDSSVRQRLDRTTRVWYRRAAIERAIPTNADRRRTGETSSVYLGICGGYVRDASVARRRRRMLRE